ncbi:MAG: formylglycine-generating enzyme family protein [Myxococcota bacterium]
MFDPCLLVRGATRGALVAVVASWAWGGCLAVEGGAEPEDSGTTGGSTGVAAEGADTSTGPGESDGDGSTSSETDDTTGTAEGCGNGQIDFGESCDGENLGELSCESLLGYEGPLGCNDDCTFDVIECVPRGMVLIPGGPFEMGAGGGAFDELPVRQVELEPFFIDALEVTVVQYAECVEAGVCLPPLSQFGCNFGVPGRDQHPINCVTWYHADTYCEWAGTPEIKRLPTEAEWEKAARGTRGLTYPWGNAPEPSCERVTMNEGNGGGCGAGNSVPVGSRPQGDSPYGVHDMAGSVWNWVADWYAPYDVSVMADPTGPETGDLRIVRGGGWDTTDPFFLRSSVRNPHEPTVTNRNIGFRCAQSLPERR